MKIKCDQEYIGWGIIVNQTAYYLNMLLEKKDLVIYFISQIEQYQDASSETLNVHNRYMT